MVAAAGIVALAAGCGGLQGPILAGLTVTTIATGLDIAWAMAFVPDGRLFFTERPGRLRVIVGGVLQPAPVLTLPVCCASGEGGLLGLAVDPGFATNGVLYVYYTHMQAGAPANRIQRLIVSGNSAAAEAACDSGCRGASRRNRRRRRHR